MNKKIIHTVFENIVEKNPNNIAIVFKNSKITYKELNTQANIVAHNLNYSSKYIGIFLPNSIDYVKSILGVLKSNNIFVPIDILAPNSRILNIINKTELKVIITNKENSQNLKNILNSLGLDIDIIILENIKSDNINNLPLKSNENDEAYVVFTSGSTGEPKAIIGMQKSLSHFIHWEIKEFGIDKTFKISQLAGVTFDVSLRDIFTVLITGATLYIPEDRTNIEYLAKWIEDEKLTLIHIVPSLFRLLVKEFEFNSYELSSLKNILLAGEALYGNDILNFNKLYPNIELVNLYGPSETTLAKIFNRINLKDVTNPNMIIPLGKPISNTAILIIKNSKLVKVKQIGEIYIKTPFRSKGYLGEDKLTDEVFIQNPLSDKKDIIYKTGDMGRYQEDGTIEFVGRVDNQVKINGIRVELEEIEIAIKSYEKIENATIVTQISNNKEISILCYYIQKEDFKESDIKEYLIEEIPSYMIPNFFIKLEHFPLNFHGKIDKKSLPKPEDLIYMNRDFIEAKSDIEKDIIEIFSDILQIKKISTDISFSQLGGNSLNSISATSKISHKFGVEINIKDFFENQTVIELSKLIEKNLTNKSNSSKNNIKIKSIPESDNYEISNSQRRLWVLDKLQTNLNAYNIIGILEFNNLINVDILQKSIEIVVSHHEILRTNFIEINGTPRQIISKNINKNIFQNIQTDNITKYIQLEAKNIFNLEKDNLFYVKLINKKILLINIHHIISDGWSINLILKELAELYSKLDNNKKIELEPLKIQYKDYSYWQNRLLEDKSFNEKHKEYWHTVLKNPTTLDFPLDNPRGVTQTFNGEFLLFTIDKRLTNKIKNLIDNSTLFITLLTITNILLSKYSNQDDIIVGTPVANRENDILINQIGFYVNSIVLRTKLKQNSSFVDNLNIVKNMVLNSFSHQQYPFDKLVDELNLDRDLSQNPLFNIMIILQNNKIDNMQFSNLNSSSKLIDTKTSKLDITFNYTEVGDDIELMIEYNTDLFKRNTIKRLFKNLETLIDSIELDKTLNKLDFISNDEQILLDSFNNIKRDYPKDKTIIEVFEDIAKKNKNNIALFCEDREITYKELNKQANIVGDFLKKEFSIKKDKIVPIILDKSELMIISLLGVLKAGGVYLPIDSSYPKDRIEYMLQDSKAKIVITDKNNEDKIKEYSNDLDIKYICIEDIKNRLDLKSKNLGKYNKASDLAYMIYTSGTTGQPKGVMVENKGFINMILYQIESFNVIPKDNIIQFASFSFDASVYETFLTLLAGASYVIVKKDELLNNFIDITKKYNVNTAVLNPTFLANIGELDNFKTIITAGEKAIVQDAVKYAKRCNYINAYGPTETSICSALYKVNPDKEYTVIPIGKSIANIKNYILNQNLDILPIGSIGEIYTFGDGLARGYLNKPELTKEKFINHKEFGRLYKSGDLARFSEDGNIEYLGRIDNQVKIRGYRVELGEIENTILTNKNITETVVIFKDNLLISYFIGKDDNLENFLKSILPEYMVPQYFINLDKFPLTPNGKIDTKNLPAPKIEIKKIIQPKTYLEIELCRIFQDILDVELGIEDSFFKFGGDSIKAIQIASRVTELGYKLDIKDLFSYPKIKDLTPFIKKTTRDISQKEIIGDISLTPIQKWFFELPVEDKSYFNQDLLLEIDNKITKKQIKKIIKTLITHHDILRASYKNNIQFNNSISNNKIFFKQYHISNQEEIVKISKKLSSNFNLDKSPLIKFALIEYENNKYIYIVAHHLVIDGISWRIIMEDLTTLFKGDNLPLKTDSFKDYSKKLKSHSKEIKNELDLWRGINFDFILPTDKKIKKRLFKNINNLSYKFDNSITQDILENINSKYNTTTQDILILSLNLALFKSFNIKKSIVSLESHGREDSLNLDLSRTIGWFTSMYPILLEHKNIDLGNQIKIQKESLRKIPNNGIGYGILKYLDNNTLNYSKEILFNYLGQFDNKAKSLVNISNLETAPLWSKNFISEFKLDISLFIINKELSISIKYDKNEYNQDTLEILLDNYKNSLLEIINHCKEKQNIELTPDDIDDEDFDINSLDEFLSDLDLDDKEK